jgi:hypothetical protein
MHPHAPKLFPASTEDVITELNNKFTHARSAQCYLRHNCVEGAKTKLLAFHARERRFGEPFEPFSAPGVATAARYDVVGQALDPFAGTQKRRAQSSLGSERLCHCGTLARLDTSGLRRGYTKVGR